jgi:hypothetical protein
MQTAELLAHPAQPVRTEDRVREAKKATGTARIILAYILITLPFFLLMQQGRVSYAMVDLALGMIPYALCQTGGCSVIPEFFPYRVRHTGGAGPYLATPCDVTD